jgi:PST family polysaccharide transporter
LLIGWLLDFHQVGLYVAATRFSEIWWAIPPLLMNALAPHYIFPSGIGDRLIRNVTLIGAAMILAGLVPCLVLALVGGPLLDVLLGSQYAGAAPILIVHVWIAVFVFVDLPVVHYLLATGRQNVLFAKSAVVLTVNTLLALALIPELGAVGAAVALLAAQAIATTAFYYLHPSTREVLGIHLRMLQIIVRGSSGVVRVIRRR